MENLNIVGPYLGDPFLYSEWENNKLEFVGKLATHHEIVIKQYFQPFADGVEAFCSQNLHCELQLNIKLSYFNTSGSKHLLSFFKFLENQKNRKGAKIFVNWYYLDDDDDMLDMVEEYEDLADLEFRLFPISDIKYWSNLNFFGDYISEEENFHFLKEIQSIYKKSLYSSEELELVYARVESILNQFDASLNFFNDFKRLIFMRVCHLLAHEYQTDERILMIASSYFLKY
jgi:hypothetical protein